MRRLGRLFIVGREGKLMNGEFGCVPIETWRLRLPESRRRRLIEAPTFEAIVEGLRASAHILSLRREKLKRQEGYYRVVAVLKVDAQALDLFHNSRCGYRAQYYLGTEAGENANSYAVKVLSSRIKELLSGYQKRTCPSEWVERSLLHEEAKVWIHQGTWLRANRRSERNLSVERWTAGLTSADRKQRRRATWAMLTPGEEQRLDVKGGFVTTEGCRFRAPLKPGRSEDICKFGFT